jgi:aminopeptidase N
MPRIYQQQAQLNKLASKPIMQKNIALLAVLIALTLSTTTLAQNSNGRVVPLPPAQYVPSHNYDTQNILLNLRFDWKHEQAIGDATITFSPLVSNLNAIELEAADMTISSVKLSSGQALRFAQNSSKQKLNVTLDKAYQPGQSLSIVITYHTNGTAETKSINGGGGLSFIQPTKSDPARPRQIWSQGESTYSHYWFPCYDNPNDFFTSQIVATVEKPLMVISNGRLVESRENQDGTRTFDWKMEQPHAGYLTSIVIGEYVPVGGTYDGIPVDTYVYPKEIEAGRVTSARLVDMVKFFSEKTGVKYPYAKYAQTVAREFNGGMENITATTQTDQIIHDARAELDETSDAIQSHELAHQWFGDYVTCRSWADLWLNESFATYFQGLWDEHNLGRDDFLYRDVGNNQNEYLAAWKKGLRRPIVTRNYANADAVFDVYGYQRGGAVLHMLRKELGEENWWRVINHYLTKYAHQPVETAQFRIAIEEVTGLSMDRFFDQWLYRMGHPVFNVSQRFDPSTRTLTLTVRQEQKADPASGYPQAYFFETPVEVEIGTKTSTRVQRLWIQPKEEQNFSFTEDSEPQLVNFDYQSTVIKELRFNKPTPALVYQLTLDQDVMGRLWALDQLKGRISDKAIPAAERSQIVSALIGAMKNDKFWGARVNLARALSGISGAEVRAALVFATRDPDAHVREAAVMSLGTSKDVSLAPLYQSLLEDPSYAVVRASALALGATKARSAFDHLSILSQEPSWHGTVTSSALQGLTVLGDKRAIPLALHLASSSETSVRRQALSLIGALGSEDPRSFAVISAAFIDARREGNSAVRAAAGEALNMLGDPRGFALLHDAR